MLNDIQLAENRLGQGLAEARRYGNYHAAVRDLPGCAIFEARPFCEQWDVLHGTLRSEKLAEQSKQQEHKKKWI